MESDVSLAVSEARQTPDLGKDLRPYSFIGWRIIVRLDVV